MWYDYFFGGGEATGGSEKPNLPMDFNKHLSEMLNLSDCTDPAIFQN